MSHLTPTTSLRHTTAAPSTPDQPPSWAPAAPTIALLTAPGGCEPQLDVHIDAALNVGLTPDEIVEALLHSAVYCGMPKALNATFVAKKVFTERGLLPGDLGQ